MRVVLFVFLFGAFLSAEPSAPAELTVLSWNLKHLGRANEDLQATAVLLQKADIVTFQEVNTSDKGRAALRQLAHFLEVFWKERICEGLSEIPTGSKERYAYLWRDTRIAYVKTDGTVLEHCPDTAITIRLGVKNAEQIVREPAFGTFQFRPEMKNFILASIHLVPSGKSPQKEVLPLFETFKDVEGPLLVAGDYNLDAGHPIFKVPREEMGFTAALTREQKTSLKMKKALLNKAYDNFFYRKLKLVKASVMNLYEAFPNKTPKEIYDNLSDHCPIVGVFSFP